MASEKRFHSLIVDTGPLIKNTITVSTIINSAEHIYSTPSILSEIKDAATRARVETTLLPFLNIRNPTPASYEAVAQFSKKTGDFPVLSRQDLGILALAYEIDGERKRTEARGTASQGKEGLEVGMPNKDACENESIEVAGGQTVVEDQDAGNQEVHVPGEESKTKEQQESSDSQEATTGEVIVERLSTTNEDGGIRLPHDTTSITSQIHHTSTNTHPVTDLISEEALLQPGADANTAETAPFDLKCVENEISNLEVCPQSESSDPDDDGEGEWITPSNVKKHRAKDSAVSIKATEPQSISVATMTTDYAMQNVLLQMKLALVSPSMQRIRNLRTYVLRCHACFLTTKEMEKQFCPRCGQPTLQRVSCSTNAKGEFRIHLAKNYQWNLRGNKYSVPKPVAGTANGKNIKGGGKGGWGNDLILAEDQKEFVRHAEQEKRSKARDLMDEDYLPGILTGDRGRAGGRAKVGAGRNINSKKRF